MSLYKKLLDALTLHDIDELGILPSNPDWKELPPDSQIYHPIVVIETKLGLSFECWTVLLKEAHEQYWNARENNDTLRIEQASRIMIILKPDNVTAMNTRKKLIKLKVVDPKDELKLLELVFTIPRHAKSGIAWYHRRWLYEIIQERESGNILDHIDLESEQSLCTRAATIYPRNYYAWQHRRWILNQITTIDLLHEEYERTRNWVERNISDYSGQHYLSLVMTALRNHSAEVDTAKHLEWLEALMLRFPGHESLWYHRRTCFAIFEATGKALSLENEHAFIENSAHSAETRRKHTAVQDEQEFLTKHIIFAYRYGYWLCIKVKDNRKRDVYASKLVDMGSFKVKSDPV